MVRPLPPSSWPPLIHQRCFYIGRFHCVEKMAPTHLDVKKFIRKLPRGKASDPDAILGRIYNAGGPTLTCPPAKNDASFVHLSKQKENMLCCGNHRGLSLLCIFGKILERLLASRLILHLENVHLPESECGFSSICMVVSNRQLQAKRQK